MSFKQFKSRESIDFSSKVINVINGIPGVGKSSFIINYLEEKSSKNKVDFIFYFNSYSINKVYTNLKSRQENINVEQVWQELGKYNLDYTRLSESLLSYMLNYRFVYFIIDGIDKEEDIENIIVNLNRYINRFHKNNNRLRVLISSRIKNLQLQQLVVNNVNLPPLDSDEIKEFFFVKAEELQMNLHQNPNFGPLVDSKSSVLRFDSKLTKTPLFVEVVLIILQERGLTNLGEGFHQSVASMYKLFIKVLYERSNKGSTYYDNFYVLYRNLAYKSWESGNNVDIEVITEIFKNSPFDIQFLTDNGFLVQYDKTQNDFSFIHQTIPDVLSIESLALKNDFSQFKNKENIREDLQTYLKDEIKTIMQYSILLSVNPKIAIALLDRSFFNKIARNEFSPATRMIIRSCLDYISQTQDIKIDTESILSIFNKLSEWQGQFYKILLDEVESYPKTISMVVILLSLETTQINDYILQLIHSKISINIFTSILEKNQHLRNIIEPYFNKIPNNPRDREIILFALEADITNQVSSFKKRYTGSLSARSDEEIAFFLAKDRIRREVFFKEYINTDITDSIRLNRLLSTVGFEDIFLPKGTYSINYEIVTNDRSITIAKQPIKKDINENSLNNTITKFQNEVVHELWTFDQCRIAYAYFEGTINNNFNGFLGLHGFNNIRYEAVKENNINRVSFFYFESNSGNSNITLSNSSNKSFKQTVLWRKIQYY